MDTRQIEYILQIAEENNITKAAEKLYIFLCARKSVFDTSTPLPLNLEGWGFLFSSFAS